MDNTAKQTPRQQKARSWWGWGNVEDAVDASELDSLIQHCTEAIPGLTLDEPHEAPSIADLDLPESTVKAPGSLAHLVSDSPADRAAHTHGKAYRDIVRNLQGDLQNVPDLIARPQSESDIVDILDWCSEKGFAAIPYGGGSSVVGGIEPRFTDYSGTVTINLEHLDQVLEIDPTSRAARIEAGILGPNLESQLRPHGLTLRHFPQSFEFSSLGGWLATRAGGHYATGLTHIDDMVESMRVVTPTGVSESRRLPGSGAGPSPDRMFLGSEGSLGIITEAWMRLQDRPRWKQSAAVHFASFGDAVAATRAVAQSGLNPANCRLLDAAEALLHAGIVTGGVLIVGFESADHPVDTSMERAMEICRDHGGTLPDSGSQPTSADQNWRNAFIRMPYQRDALTQRSMIMETFETACTWDQFEGLHAAITGAVNQAIGSIGGVGLVACRFTHVYPDGPAPYYGVYMPGEWNGLLKQWDDVKAAVSEAISSHGGTITHHHAVGRDHRPWYDRQRPEPFAAALQAAKGALDPAGILNPGAVIPGRPTST